MDCLNYNCRYCPNDQDRGSNVDHYDNLYKIALDDDLINDMNIPSIEGTIDDNVMKSANIESDNPT